MFGKTLILVLLLPVLAEAQSARIRGEIIALPERFSAGIEVVLKKGGKPDARTAPNESGRYEFDDLQNGKYDLVVRSKGKEARRRVELFCGPESTAIVDVVFDKNDTPSLNVYFPVEDPDVTDVAELKRDYPKAVLRDYDNALEDLLEGNNSRAVERLESVIKRAPDFYSAHARLGMVYQQIGCYREAEREYLISRQLSPRSAQPLVNLASVLIQAAGAGLHDEDPLDLARNALREAIRLKPASSLAYSLLGTVNYKSGAFEEAEGNLKEALDMQSRMIPARLMLANLYLRQEKWEDALEHLDTFLKDHPLAPDRDQVKRIRNRVAQTLKSN